MPVGTLGGTDTVSQKKDKFDWTVFELVDYIRKTAQKKSGLLIGLEMCN